MIYKDFLASLHREYLPRWYLEIGIRRGAALQIASCPAIGVDPAFDLDYTPRSDTHLFRETSDAFFSSGQIEKVLGSNRLDLAFIDGWHNAEFALRDFMNIEGYSNPGAIIVFDDVKPLNEDEAVRQPHGRAWTGDVWKITDVLARYRPELHLTYVDVAPRGLLIVQNLNPSDIALPSAYKEIASTFVEPTAQLMPHVSYAERFVDSAAALRRISSFSTPGRTATVGPRKIANIIVVRFSLRMSDDWSQKAYGAETNREAWLAMRAQLFRDTLYASLKAQTEPARKVLLLMDKGDAAAFDKYLSFDSDLIQALFIDGLDFNQAAQSAIAEVASHNVAISRIDSDDIISDNYLESINATISRLVDQSDKPHWIVSIAGFRTDGKLIQQIAYHGSPFLTLFMQTYNGEDVYQFPHEEVLRHEYSVCSAAHWAQVIHGSNIGNQFVASQIGDNEFHASVLPRSGKPSIVASRIRPVEEAAVQGMTALKSFNPVHDRSLDRQKTSRKLDDLRKLYPKPDVSGIMPYRFSLDGGGRHLVSSFVKANNSAVMVEIGVFLGGSCRDWLESSTDLIVIGVDAWSDSYNVVNDLTRYRMDNNLCQLFKHVDNIDEFFDSLGKNGFFKSALANLTAYGDRFIPVRGLASQALKDIQRLGIRPDIIYIDADKKSLTLEEAHSLFPDAALCGDDWTWGEALGFPMQKAVNDFAKTHNMKVATSGATWFLTKTAG